VAKIPPEAFEYYVGLGLQRSYQAVADRYGTSKRAVTKRAAAEKWAERLLKIERTARERIDNKMTETLEAVNARHLQTLRAIQAKALNALQVMSLDSCMDAVRALDTAIRQERVILGEPGERNAVSVEDVIKREYERWMTAPSDNGRKDDDTVGGN
jgi:hypothetical protein